jgi:hypothetical protein
MACPDAIAQGYGGSDEGSPLAYTEGTGSNRKWYPATCDSVVSGSGATAVINITIYPVAGGSQTRTNIAYSQNGVSGYWTCTETIEPGAVARG